MAFMERGNVIELQDEAKKDGSSGWLSQELIEFASNKAAGTANS